MMKALKPRFNLRALAGKIIETIKPKFNLRSLIGKIVGARKPAIKPQELPPCPPKAEIIEAREPSIKPAIKLKKPKRYGPAEVEMTASKMQKYHPHALSDTILSVVAKRKKENYIVTLPGNKQQRSKDFQKDYSEQKQYRLKPHTFGTKLKVEDPSDAGKYVQAWYIGDEATLEMDMKRARILGPQAYYAPKGLVSHCLKIVVAVGREADKFYTGNAGYSETLNRINQAIYAINMQSQYKFDAHTTYCIKHAVKEFFRAGYKSHIKGGKNAFGKGPGAPAKKTTEKKKRISTFHEAMNSKKGKEIIHSKALKICKELKIKCTKRILQIFHIEIRRYYWSDRYIKGCNLKPGCSPFAIIEHCLKAISGDLFFMVANAFVHKDVDKYVSNSNNYRPYYSPRRRITNQINISESNIHHPPPKSFKKDLKRGDNSNIEDKSRAFRQETGGFIDIQEIITKNISIETDVKEKEIPRVAEDAPNTDREGPTGSLEVGEVGQLPPTCFEAVEAPVSEIEPSPTYDGDYRAEGFEIELLSTEPAPAAPVEPPVEPKRESRYKIKANPYGLSAQEIERARSRLMRSFDLMAGKNVEPEPEPVRRRPLSTAEKLRAMGISND